MLVKLQSNLAETYNVASLGLVTAVDCDILWCDCMCGCNEQQPLEYLFSGRINVTDHEFTKVDIKEMIDEVI